MHNLSLIFEYPSVQHKEQSFSAPFILYVSSTQKNRQFNTPVSLTHKKRQFDTKNISSTQKNVSSNHKKRQYVGMTLFLCWTDGFLYWTDGFVEQTHLTCWTDGFSGLKRSGPGLGLICRTEGYSIKIIPTNNVRYL